MIKRLLLWLATAGALAAMLGVGGAAAAPTTVTCGDSITAPGDYVLAGDCTWSRAFAIVIMASNVELALDGHTVTGVFGAFSGIAAQGVSGLHIEGPGTITGFEHFGVGFADVSRSSIEQVTTNDDGVGIFLTGSPGSSANVLTGNTATNNRSTGIDVASGTGNRIVGNTALSNGVDLADHNAGCDQNKWNGNVFVTANQSCIH